MNDSVDPGDETIQYADSLTRAVSDALGRLDAPEETAGVDEFAASGGYRVALDRGRQVIRLDVPKDRGWGDSRGSVDAALAPSFVAAGGSGSFVPAAALALKAKQFDDGLYAAVELASDAGQMEFMTRLLSAAEEAGADAGAAIVHAALELGGQSAQAGTSVRTASQQLREGFLADARRSKPLGFYTWSHELAAVFRRDRMLQTPLEPDDARGLGQVLEGEALRGDYGALLLRAERLTNPLVGPDLREPLAIRTQAALLPASRSHEAALIKQLYGNAPIPDDFDLADELIARVRDRRLDLTPSASSGWYDHQAWALEPLIVPERTPEAEHLELTPEYRAELVGLFKALLALTRETHVKQLEIPAAGAAMRDSELVIELWPELSVEPLATYYLRRARSYAFIRRELEELLGAEAFGALRRRTADGPIDVSLADELALMEGLFYGAHATACQQTGTPVVADERLLFGQQANTAVVLFEAWSASSSDDPDLGRDVRMMVPVFYDRAREKMKVWAVLGVATKPLVASFATPPEVVSVMGSDGARVDLASIRVEWKAARHTLAYLVTAECYVSTLLDREEFRALCDRHETFGKILDALE